MDKSPIFIRPYHVKEEDKSLIDKEMKWLCYLCILKEAYFSLFQSSDANQQETHKRQKSSDRLQALKCENSKEQSHISTT